MGRLTKFVGEISRSTTQRNFEHCYVCQRNALNNPCAIHRNSCGHFMDFQNATLVIRKSVRRSRRCWKFSLITTSTTLTQNIGRIIISKILAWCNLPEQNTAIAQLRPFPSSQRTLHWRWPDLRHYINSLKNPLVGETYPQLVAYQSLLDLINVSKYSIIPVHCASVQAIGKVQSAA